MRSSSSLVIFHCPLSFATSRRSPLSTFVPFAEDQQNVPRFVEGCSLRIRLIHHDVEITYFDFGRLCFRKHTSIRRQARCNDRSLNLTSVPTLECRRCRYRYRHGNHPTVAE